MHKQISKNYYYKYKPIKKPLTLFHQEIFEALIHASIRVDQHHSDVQRDTHHLKTPFNNTPCLHMHFSTLCVVQRILCRYLISYINGICFTNTIIFLIVPI